MLQSIGKGLERRSGHSIGLVTKSELALRRTEQAVRGRSGLGGAMSVLIKQSPEPRPTAVGKDRPPTMVLQAMGDAE